MEDSQKLIPNAAMPISTSPCASFSVQMPQILSPTCSWVKKGAVGENIMRRKTSINESKRWQVLVVEKNYFYVI